MKPVFRDYDQAALDAQYNNRALVPDFAEHMDRWARDSVTARRELPCRLDIPYGPAALERLDLFPGSGEGAPLHVFIHGGYWRALDKGSFSFLASAFVKSGVSFAALNYPLAPAARMDSIVHSIRRAIHWIASHPENLGIDPRRITISGHSAGGHLVAIIIATDWSRFGGSGEGFDPQLAGAVSLSGLYDLEPIRLSYLNADLHLDSAQVVRNSPIGLATRSAVPLALAVGSLESKEFLRQQHDFHSTWQRQGHALESHVLEGHNHFTIVQEIGRADSALHRWVVRRCGES